MAWLAVLELARVGCALFLTTRGMMGDDVACLKGDEVAFCPPSKSLRFVTPQSTGFSGRGKEFAG